MYGYQVWNGEFKELGEIEWYSRDFNPDRETNYIIPIGTDHNKGYKVCKQAFTKEGKVFKHRTVWLSEDDPKKAKKLFAKDFKKYFDKIVKDAEKQLNYRMAILSNH